MKLKLATFLRRIADHLDPSALMAEGYAEQSAEALNHPGTVYYSTSVQYMADPRFEGGTTVWHYVSGGQ